MYYFTYYIFSINAIEIELKLANNFLKKKKFFFGEKLYGIHLISLE